MQPEFIDNIRKVQAEVLENYSRIVKPGGKLVYATCSVLPSENQEQVKKFLTTENGKNFTFVQDKKILASDSGFDGFYMALLERKNRITLMMKKYFLFVQLFIVVIGFSQQSYYNSINFNNNGQTLKNQLAQLITTTHVNYLTYTPGVWNALKIVDLDPANANNVLLIYGWENGTDGDVTNDRSRNKELNGGNVGDWNREHVYAQSSWDS